MFKISFVSPSIGLEERYGKLASVGSTMPSMALLSLAAVARESNFESIVIPADSLNLDYNEVLDRVFNFSSGCLGITSTTFSIYQANQLATLAKKRDKRIITLIGGPHVTALPEKTMSMFPDFDIAVTKEGEATIVELLKALSEEESIEQIKGIVFRKDGDIARTADREPIKNLDSLPYPAWDLLEGFPNRYHPPIFRFKNLPAASILTSRGCPNQCIFCSKSVFGNNVRMFSSGYVFDMIQSLHNKYGVREFLIEDDTFLVAKDRVRDICEQILKNDLKISWSCLGRVDNVEENLLRIMKKAGCWQIGYGIESGSQAVLDFAKKGINLDKVREALAITKKVGMLSKGFFILGFPNDSRETIRDTINFAKSIGLKDITVNFMTPLPGTELYQKAKDYGEFDDDWKKMNLLKIVFVPKGLSKDELERYSKVFVREFYLRPKIIFSYFLRILRHPFYFVRIVKAFWGFLNEIF